MSGEQPAEITRAREVFSEISALPEGDCSCAWSTDGTHQTSVCPGHKALTLLSCCGAGEGCISPTCSGTPGPTTCSNCESGSGDFVCIYCEDGDSCG